MIKQEGPWNTHPVWQKVPEGNEGWCRSRLLLEHCSVPAFSLEGGWGSPGHVFSGCHSTVWKASACAFSRESAERRSDQRTDTEQVSLLCIAVLVVVIIHYIPVLVIEIWVLFKTLCIYFVDSKRLLGCAGNRFFLGDWSWYLITVSKIRLTRDMGTSLKKMNPLNVHTFLI